MVEKRDPGPVRVENRGVIGNDYGLDVTEPVSNERHVLVNIFDLVDYDNDSALFILPSDGERSGTDVE